MWKLLLFASTIATIAAATALPGGAATPATFELTAGALSISAPDRKRVARIAGGGNSSSTISRLARRRHGFRPARRSNDLDRVRDLDRLHSSGRPGRPGQQRQLCGGHDHGVRAP